MLLACRLGLLLFLLACKVVKNALAHGYDVLLCTQDVDEFMFQVMRSYKAEALVPADAKESGADDSTDSTGSANKTASSENATSEPSLCDLEFTNVSAADLNLASEKEQEEAKPGHREDLRRVQVCPHHSRPVQQQAFGIRGAAG